MPDDLSIAAIGAFERTLTTPSPFDEFLRGDSDALSAAEQRGLKVFVTAGGVALPIRSKGFKPSSAPTFFRCAEDLIETSA